MKVLVTGSAGFIGSALSIRLLNRGDSYFCCLKHNQKPPSVSAIAVSSSKLKYYSESLKQKADNDSRKSASDFEVLSARLDSVMYQQSKHVWMKQMVEAKKNERANALKEVKRLCK